MPAFKKIQITFSVCIFGNKIKNKFRFHRQKYSDTVLSEYSNLTTLRQKTWGYFQIILKAPLIQNFTLKFVSTHLTNQPKQITIKKNQLFKEPSFHTSVMLGINREAFNL